MRLDSYADTGLVVGVALVNALAIRHAGGRPVAPQPRLPQIAKILEVDPPSLRRLADADVPGFVELACHLRDVFDDLHRGEVDSAAGRLNRSLARHPAAPHLAKEDGRWRLHHHPVDMAIVPMWTSICAEATARMIGSGHHDRLDTCDADDCERVFIDLSRNASRRFCSTSCQNRTKTAAFRRRRASRDS